MGQGEVQQPATDTAQDHAKELVNFCDISSEIGFYACDLHALDPERKEALRQAMRCTFNGA